MSKDTIRQYANLLSVILALTVNILASTLPLNGQNTGEISDRFQVYFVPAGYVFAIWGVIYIGWIAFIIFQFRASQKESARLRRLGYLFALSNIILICRPPLTTAMEGDGTNRSMRACVYGGTVFRFFTTNNQCRPCVLSEGYVTVPASAYPIEMS